LTLVTGFPAIIKLSNLGTLNKNNALLAVGSNYHQK
jgi:hypothetical protein